MSKDDFKKGSTLHHDQLSEFIMLISAAVNIPVDRLDLDITLSMAMSPAEVGNMAAWIRYCMIEKVELSRCFSTIQHDLAGFKAEYLSDEPTGFEPRTAEYMKAVDYQLDINAAEYIKDHGEAKEIKRRYEEAFPKLLEACKYAKANLSPKGDVRKDFNGHNAMATLSKAIYEAEPPEKFHIVCLGCGETVSDVNTDGECADCVAATERLREERD